MLAPVPSPGGNVIAFPSNPGTSFPAGGTPLQAIPGGGQQSAPGRPPLSVVDGGRASPTPTANSIPTRSFPPPVSSGAPAFIDLNLPSQILGTGKQAIDKAGANVRMLDAYARGNEADYIKAIQDFDVASGSDPFASKKVRDYYARNPDKDPRRQGIPGNLNPTNSQRGNSRFTPPGEFTPPFGEGTIQLRWSTTQGSSNEYTTSDTPVSLLQTQTEDSNPYKVYFLRLGSGTVIQLFAEPVMYTATFSFHPSGNPSQQRNPQEQPGTLQAPSPAAFPATGGAAALSPAISPSASPQAPGSPQQLQQPQSPQQFLPIPQLQPQAIPTALPSPTPSPAPSPLPRPGQSPSSQPGGSPSSQPGQSPQRSPYSQPGTNPGAQPRPGSRTDPGVIPVGVPAGSVPIRQPTINNDQLSQINPRPRPRPSQQERCNDPCLIDIKRQNDGQQFDLSQLLEFLRALLDLANQLLQGQQEIEQKLDEEPSEQEQPITIQVPIASCNGDGTAQIEQVTVTCWQEDADRLKLQFQELAAVKVSQCRSSRFTERSYNVLGGDDWFESTEVNDKPNRKFKPVEELGLFGFRSFYDDKKEQVTGNQQEQTAASITEFLVKNLATFYYKFGLNQLPTQVPKTLLSYSDGEKPQELHSYADYLGWIVQNIDALLGQFPIEIEIEDSDPLEAGNQVKKVEIPNVAEALTELYGLGISGATNANVAINFLTRLAAEIVATKNATLITQDYAKANASYLGYKANTPKRQIPYAFNPTKLDSLEGLLQEWSGEIVGWEEDDKNSVTDYLQRLMFASGIIKAAFFRGKKDLKQLEREIESITKENDKNYEEAFQAFLAMVNDPQNRFNRGDNPDPKIDKEPLSEAEKKQYAKDLLDKLRKLNPDSFK